MIFESLTLLQLQQYLWMIMSFILACLFFMFFVQGGQILSMIISKNSKEKDKIIEELSKRYELAFTAFVIFGGSMFAIFPLFYSTSFGGAYFVRFFLLFLFIIEGVSFKYRKKVSNFLGTRTYEIFLFLNGIFTPFLLGIMIATFFTGSNFIVEKNNLIGLGGGGYAISSWTNPFHGFEALWNTAQGAFITNLSLGFASIFVSVILACLYIIKNVDDKILDVRSSKALKFILPIFLMFFGLFLYKLFTIKGFAYDPITKEIFLEDYKYLNNFLEMPQFFVLFIVGCISFIVGVLLGIKKNQKTAFWLGSLGFMFVMFSIFAISGLNNTVFYPSLVGDFSHSLTIENSSSSLYTMKVLSYTTLFIPFVVFYISYVWRILSGPLKD